MSAKQMSSVPMAPTNYAYTRHMLTVAHTGSAAEITVVALPCAWIYCVVGQHLLKDGPPKKHHPYRDWLMLYASPEFAEVQRWMRKKVDQWAKTAGTEEKRRMEESFVISSRYEWMFWEMAWNEAGRRSCELTDPVADQPVRPRTPPGVGTPLRADGRPGQRHPSSHDGPERKWKGQVRRRAAEPFHCSRNARPVGNLAIPASRGRAGENRKQALVGREHLAQPCYLPEEDHRPPEGEKNKEPKAVLKQERSRHE